MSSEETRPEDEEPAEAELTEADRFVVRRGTRVFLQSEDADFICIQEPDEPGRAPEREADAEDMRRGVAIILANIFATRRAEGRLALGKALTSADNAVTVSYLGRSLRRLAEKLLDTDEPVAGLPPDVRGQLAAVCEAFAGIVPKTTARETRDPQIATYVQFRARETLGAIASSALAGELETLPEGHSAALVAQVRAYYEAAAAAFESIDRPSIADEIGAAAQRIYEREVQAGHEPTLEAAHGLILGLASKHHDPAFEEAPAARRESLVQLAAWAALAIVFHEQAQTGRPPANISAVEVAVGAAPLSPTPAEMALAFFKVRGHEMTEDEANGCDFACGIRVERGRATVAVDIEAEAQRLQRLGGGSHESLRVLLGNVVSAVEMTLDNEATRQDPDEGAVLAPVPRRQDLLTIAAWSWLALRRHDADPAASLEADPSVPAEGDGAADA